jgi:hypothetical protein
MDETFIPDEVTFIPALPGWEVLYYRRASATRGPEFSTMPVIAWGVYMEENLERAQPVTADGGFGYDEARTICSPNGEVICGDLEHWDNVWHWFDAMKRRETTAPETLPPEQEDEPTMADPRNVLAMDKYRHKFQLPRPPLDTVEELDDDDEIA